MTSEQKQILLKDLCARLLYHPTVKIYNDSWEGCKIGEFDNNLYYHHVEAFVCDRIEIKPYLRPMSSMTEEEKKELSNCENSVQRTDFFYSHHIDCRFMIEKGLALKAPKDMYKKN